MEKMRKGRNYLTEHEGNIGHQRETSALV